MPGVDFSRQAESRGPGRRKGIQELVHLKKGIADNTATAVITVTVPNKNVSAGIFLELVGALGTGTDTFESTRIATGAIAIARQAGANVVPAAATLGHAQIATVSGGGTLTLAYAVSAVTGGVAAVNTFTITVTLAKTGTITDLQCMVRARLLDAEGAGVAMARA